MTLEQFYKTIKTIYENTLIVDGTPIKIEVAEDGDNYYDGREVTNIRTIYDAAEYEMDDDDEGQEAV